MTTEERKSIKKEIAALRKENKADGREALGGNRKRQNEIAKINRVCAQVAAGWLKRNASRQKRIAILEGRLNS